MLNPPSALVLDDVYGLDFGPIKSAVFRTGYLSVPPASAVVTSSAYVADLDLATCRLKHDSFLEVLVRLVAARLSTVHAFIAWFDHVFTRGRREVRIFTGPFAPATRWKSTVFHAEEPIELARGVA